MNLLIAVGLKNEKKLFSKLEPLVHLPMVERIYVARREYVSADKIICHKTPFFLSWNFLLSEIFRIIVLFWRCAFNKIDILIGIHFIAHCYYVALLGFIFQKPYIIVFIEDPKIYKPDLIFTAIIKNASRIAVRGTASREYLSALGVSREKIFIPANIFSFNSSFGYTKGPDIIDILFVGNFGKEKRLDVFVEVVERIKKEIPRVRVVMAGDGVLKNDIRNMIKKRGLQQSISLFPPQGNVNALYQKTKVFLLTSGTEGLPMVVVEAMQAGVPCVVSDVGDVKDVAKEGYNAFVIKQDDVSGYAQACLKLLKDEGLCEKMSDNARNISQEKKEEYSLEYISSLWGSVLKSLKN